MSVQKRKSKELDDAISNFYTDLDEDGLMQNTTIIIFSEFGRRVKDNGKGTDHGKAAPMFVIGGTKGNSKIIGKKPDLSNLDNGDPIYDIDFKSVYASLLKDKFNFDPKRIDIHSKPLNGLF